MEHQSLYRKYRSQLFEEVVGQQHVTRTLQNALARDQVAHAYLFCGPRGTGKTTTARLLAKALNCVHGPTPEPCNECALCRNITAGRAMDVVEVDAASETGISNVREVIINNSRYAPAEGRYKVYIIDEVHDLSRAAFDGLLKTLEEPPAHVVFVLATTEMHKVPATIISRCQRFEFRRGTLDEVRSRVEFVARGEGVTIEPAAATLIARAAQGGWRDALSLLEQMISYCGDHVTSAEVGSALGNVEDERLANLTRLVLQQDALGSLQALNEILARGKDIRQLVGNLADYLRDCLVKNMGAEPEGSRPLLDIESAQAMRLLELTARSERELRWNTQHRLVVELMLLRMALNEPVSVSAAPVISASGSPPAPKRSARDMPAVRPPQSDRTGVNSDGGFVAKPVPRVQEEEPQISSTPVVGGEEGDLAVVHAQWKPFLHQVGLQSRRLQALLKEATPVSCTGGMLTLEFRHQYHYSTVDDPGSRRQLEGILAPLIGHSLRIACRLIQEPGSRPAQRSVSSPSDPVTDMDLNEIFPGWEVQDD